MSSAQPLSRMTPDQYLEAERAAEFKSEYYDGHMYAMAGGTQVHNFILINTAAALLPISRKRGCVVNTSDLRLRVSYAGLYTYPDIMVTCGSSRFADDRKDTVLNPILIVEVLSPSTEAHDRGFKFAQYRELDSLREYILIAQLEPRVERFERQPAGQWLLTEYKGLEAEARFESLDCEIPLAKIYTDVSFPFSQDQNRMV